MRQDARQRHGDVPDGGALRQAPPGAPASLRAWIELLRAPNLLTVPGDACAGWALAALSAETASWWRLGLCVIAGLGLYAFGLILNDVADRQEDARDRPGRPIPSGRIHLREARMGALVALAAGLGAAWACGVAAGVTAGILAACVAAYDLGGKRRRVCGPLLMGACRGLDVLLGAVGGAGSAALGRWEPLLGVGAVWLYVSAVTVVARDEMAQRQERGVRWLPGVAATLALCAVAICGGGGGASIGSFAGRLPGLAAGIALGAWVATAAWRIGARIPEGTPVERRQAAIGAWLRGLVGLQAALTVLWRPWGWTVAPVLLALGLGARRLARYTPMS